MIKSISSSVYSVEPRRYPIKGPVFTGNQRESFKGWRQFPSANSEDQFSFSPAFRQSVPMFNFPASRGPSRPGTGAMNLASNARPMQILIELPEGMSPEDLPPEILQQIFSMPPRIHQQEPPLSRALTTRNFDQIRDLLERGASLRSDAYGRSFTDILLSMVPQHAKTLVQGLTSKNIIPTQKIQRLLAKDMFSFNGVPPQERKQLMELSDTPVISLNASLYKRAKSERIARFHAPLSSNEQILLKRITPIWNDLSPQHKRMIDSAVNDMVQKGLFQHIVTEPFSSSESRGYGQTGFFGLMSLHGRPVESQSLSSMPAPPVDDIWSGSHFAAGLKTIPRLLGLVKALEVMSERPAKNYRWFTQGRNLDWPVYRVPTFNEKFPRGIQGVYSPDYIQRLGSNFTDDFSLAMETLRKRNHNRISANTLHNADIGFTLDNGDGHDVACRIRFYRDAKNGGKLVGRLMVIDSYPKHLEESRRPGQDKAFKNLDSLAQAYFTSVLGWNEKDVPDMSTRVIYMNNQFNGYCTSNAVDHMLAKGLNESATQTHPSLPGWATTIKMEPGKAHRQPRRDTQGKLELDSANSIYFLKRTMDKLTDARMILHLPEYQSWADRQKRKLTDGLAQVYGAMRMDQVNTAEGRVFDYHDTRLNNQPWREMVAEAKREYEQDPFWRQHFESPKAYVTAKLLGSIITPVQIENEMRLMDSREVTYYRSREKVEDAHG